MEKSTGNALKKFSTQPICHIVTDEVYTNLEQSNAKEAMDVNSLSAKSVLAGEKLLATCSISM